MSILKFDCKFLLVAQKVEAEERGGSEQKYLIALFSLRGWQVTQSDDLFSDGKWKGFIFLMD